MDITDVKSDAASYAAMLDRAVVEAPEVRDLIDQGESGAVGSFRPVR